MNMVNNISRKNAEKAVKMDRVLRYGWQKGFSRKAHIVDASGKTLCKIENSDQSGPLVGFGATVPNGRKACKICKLLVMQKPAKADGSTFVSDGEWEELKRLNNREIGKVLHMVQSIGWLKARHRLFAKRELWSEVWKQD